MSAENIKRDLRNELKRTLGHIAVGSVSAQIFHRGEPVSVDEIREKIGEQAALSFEDFLAARASFLKAVERSTTPPENT